MPIDERHRERDGERRSRDDDVLARARPAPGPSCRAATSSRSQIARAASRVGRDAARRSLSTSGPSGRSSSSMRDARAHGVRTPRARRAPSASAVERAQVDGLRRVEQLDGGQVAQTRARSRAIFATTYARHRRVVLDALRHGQAVERRRIGEMADLVAQRGQRLLDRRETRVLRAAARELQRQVRRTPARYSRRQRCDAQRRRVREREAERCRTRARAPGMWKLPLDSIAPASATTSGLSAALLSSISTSSRARAQRRQRARRAPARRSATTADPARGAPHRAPRARCRRAASASRAAIVGLSRRRPRRLRARIERRQVGAKALERQRDAATFSASQRCSAVVQHQRRVADGRRVGADEREAILGAERDRRKPGARAAPRRRAAISPRTRLRLRRSAASARCDSGGRSATPIEPKRGTTRMHAAVEHRDERVEHGGRHAGAAARHARRRARTSSRAPTSRRKARPDADRARAHRAPLVGS